MVHLQLSVQVSKPVLGNRRQACTLLWSKASRCIQWVQQAWRAPPAHQRVTLGQVLYVLTELGLSLPGVIVVGVLRVMLAIVQKVHSHLSILPVPLLCQAARSAAISICNHHLLLSRFLFVYLCSVISCFCVAD